MKFSKHRRNSVEKKFMILTKFLNGHELMTEESEMIERLLNSWTPLGFTLSTLQKMYGEWLDDPESWEIV